MRDRPYFLWDVEITEPQLRERLHHADADTRAQWQARIMREARFDEVWQYLTLDEILANWEPIKRHLGRRRAIWEFLLRGWREDGLLSA
jgi:hypothetical protein